MDVPPFDRGNSSSDPDKCQGLELIYWRVKWNLVKFRDVATQSHCFGVKDSKSWNIGKLWLGNTIVFTSWKH